MPPANPHPAAPALLLAGAVTALAACGEPAPVRGPESAGAARDTARADASRNLPGRIYERRFVFTTSDPDSAVLVPLFFSARTLPGGVDRSVRGWTYRNGAWESFVDEEWSTPPGRAPWRILPRGPVRLVVGEGDAIQALIHRDGSRRMELAPGASLVEWAGPRGETLLLREASLAVTGGELTGFLLDLSRARRQEDPPHGDWAFLVSGDSLQVVLAAPRRGGDGEPGEASGFGRVDFRDLRWSRVGVEWTESRSYEPARRSVPVGWRIRTPTGELRGTLESESVALDAGRADGPVRPVSALYAVTGTLRIEGVAYPVRGLLRHRRE